MRNQAIVLSMLAVVSSGCLLIVGEEDGGGPTQCGSATCGAGLVCCNESCGICAPIGGACTQQACSGPDAGPVTCPPVVCTLACQYGFQKGPNGCGTCTCAPAPDAGQTTCGSTLCDPGFECCNASCGICTPPQGSCTQQLCTQPLN